MATRPDVWILMLGVSLGTACTMACDSLGRRGPSLSVERGSEEKLTSPKAADGPMIGALARRVTVRSAPNATASVVGFLTAGAVLSRSDQAAGHDGCAAGWYEVAPRGFVCADHQTTLDRGHPTLVARALAPNRAAALPYPYAIARRKVALFEPDPAHQDGVRERGRLRQGAVFAIVGSWETLDEYDQRQRLAMLTHGSFVPARDIAPVEPEAPTGLALAETTRLPVAIPVAKKIPLYRFNGTHRTTHGYLEGTNPIAVTPRSRSFDDTRHWLLPNDGAVSEHDVRLLRQRHEFPSFVAANTHWVELDVDQSMLVLYVGERPTYVLRITSALDRSMPRGVARVRSKLITELATNTNTTTKSADPFDAPWLIELDNGQRIRAALQPGEQASTNDGEVVGPKGAIELAPEDAARLFHFVAPTVPDGWHGVVVTGAKGEHSPFVVR